MLIPVLTLGCVSTGVRERVEPAGYVVIGARWAETIQAAAGDTLAEASSESVPDKLRAAAAALARTESLGEAQCNRFFTSRRRTVVLFSPFCENRYGSVYGAREFAVFESDGTIVQQFRTVGTDEVLSIVPYYRFSR